MIEIPESNTIANQLNKTIKGKKIVSVITNYHPHKFAFFYNDPKGYNDLLKGKIIGGANAYGGQISISSVEESKIKNDFNKYSDNNLNSLENRNKFTDEEMIIVLGEDTLIKYIDGEEIPEKNQLLIKFEDSTAIVCSARMYAQLHVSLANNYKNEYFDIAVNKPSPLSDNFDFEYFENLISEVRPISSVKSFLATKQRIPGLGNGTLQDILFNAKINPKSKLKKLSKEDKINLFNSIKRTLFEMTDNGGRNTEKTLFGEYGDYEVILSSKTFKNPCPLCGDKIIKESYLGGTIYYCPTCQELKTS